MTATIATMPTDQVILSWFSARSAITPNSNAIIAAASKPGAERSWLPIASTSRARHKELSASDAVAPNILFTVNWNRRGIRAL